MSNKQRWVLIIGVISTLILGVFAFASAAPTTQREGNCVLEVTDSGWTTTCTNVATPTPTPSTTPTTAPTTAPTTVPPTTPPASTTTTVPVTPTTTTSGPMLNCAALPSRCGFPDATNTGVPAGTTLTPFTGNITAGMVINGKTLGCQTISVANVTIRNSRVSGQCFWVIRSNSSGLIIEDSELSCNGSTGSGIGGAGYIVRRTEITGCENGAIMDRNASVVDSYVHDMFLGNGGHTDSLQVYGGATNILIQHNTLFNENNGGTSAIIADNDGMTNVNIKSNLLAGGAYTLYCPTTTAGETTNNRISKKFKANGGQYGPWIHCELANPRTGNVWDETNQAIPF